MIKLTDDQVREFSNLLHIIPVSKGLTRAWLDANAPGYTSAELAAELISSGRVEKVEDHPPLVLI